jgi:hypothetical protein
MEEALEAPDVIIGMFFINDTSAVVLFESGASHLLYPHHMLRKYAHGPAKMSNAS